MRCKFDISGEEAELDRFRRLMLVTVTQPVDGGNAPSVDVVLDFAAILPPPAGIGDDDEEWQAENWGSVWNARNLALTTEQRGLLGLRFDVPWEFPHPILAALAAEFRGLTFRGDASVDDILHFAGEFNGRNDWGAVPPGRPRAGFTRR